MGEHENKKRPKIEGGEDPLDGREGIPDQSETDLPPSAPAAGAEEVLRANEAHRDEISASMKREAEPKPPIVFIGGFTSPESAYADEIKHLESQGYTVHYLNPDEGEDLTPEEKTYFTRLNESAERPVPELVQRQGAAVRAYVEQNGIENPIIVCHSKGGGVGTAYAASHPEAATQLILDNPVGLVGDDTAKQLFARARGTQSSSSSRAAALERKGHLWSAFKIPAAINLLKRPLFRIRHEIPAMAETDIRDMLHDIKERGGTEIVLLNAQGDRTFPEDRVADSLGEAPFEQYIDRWAFYADKDAEHNAPIVERAGVLQQVIEERPAVTGEK